MENKKFIKLILNDEYINWINIFIEQYGEFDDCYFLHNGREFLSEKDIVFFGYILTLFDQIHKYLFKNFISFKNNFMLFAKNTMKIL